MKLRALQSFAETELDSAWQSLYAMEHITDPKKRAELLMHAVEELGHANLFLDLAKKKSGKHLARAINLRQPVVKIENEASLSSFLAYMSVGEREVLKDFREFCRSKIDEDIRSTFAQILKEEEHHGTVAEDLTEHSGVASKRSLRFLYFKARWQKRYLWASKVGLAVGEQMLTEILAVFYFVFGPLLAGSMRKRMELSAPEQLELFKHQLQSSNVNLSQPRTKA